MNSDVYNFFRNIMKLRHSKVKISTGNCKIIEIRKMVLKYTINN